MTASKMNTLLERVGSHKRAKENEPISESLTALVSALIDRIEKLEDK